MQLKTRLILLTVLVVCLSYGVTFYRTASFQEELVVNQATRQAKMLFNQIRLTRQWITDHNGLFLIKGPGVEKNPFLEHGEIQDAHGAWLVKRNPAMVTRELSAYAAEAGMGQFNVTSLKPVNPKNSPDDFEIRSLKKFENGTTETVEIQEIDGTRRLRYMAPLKVDDGCLVCHNKQGYKLDDIRGGMNVSIPMGWAYAEIRSNNRMLIAIALLTIIGVSVTLYLLFDTLVAKRLTLLADMMNRYPNAPLAQYFSKQASNDEIGSLNKQFFNLCERLESSQQQLNDAREQVFQSEKQAALGRLVAGISHEINNPLNGMQNCVQTMQRNADPELQKRYLTLIGQGVDRIKGTVQQLLNIGRHEPLAIKTADIDVVIRDCLELTCMGNRQISLDLNLTVGRQVTTGIEALHQVIMNLGGNAVQAIGNNSGIISVTSRLSNNVLQIQVCDDGPGIAPEHLDKIFEPFFTTKEVGEGTGLGLSVSHSLISQLGGTLTAANLPDGGAYFTLTVPILATEDS